MQKVQPNVTVNLARAIEEALTKTESCRDKEYAAQLVRGFKDAAAKAEALYRSLPNQEKQPPRWM